MSLRLILLGALTVALTAAAHAAPDALTLLRHGRYAEARQAYERLLVQQPAVAAIGIARCHEAVGSIEEAVRALADGAKREPKSAGLHAEWAALEFERGRYDSAKVHVDAALRADPDQPQARWWLAELHRVAGRIDDANQAYGWLISYYNAQQDSLADPETYRWIGRGAAQYARWNRNSGQFHFLVNTLYPEAVTRDSTYWPAHLESALLFIEKYNRPDAQDELRAALATNPNAAEAHAARALIALQEFDLDSARVAIDRALAINPRLIRAFQLRADVAMLTSGARAAQPALERARELNPVDEETLGRLAAIYGVIDGLREGASPRMAALIGEVEKRNPHCGVFYASMAASLDLLQLLPDAAHYNELAQHRMPQLVDVPGHMGMLAMRLGDETRARELLQQAFEIDPYNVRVGNSLKVLDLLQNYGTIETPHFAVRFDRSRDSLLAAQAGRWLEDQVYPEITKIFGYAPPGRTPIEIFSSHGGTSAHGWFSTRMVGLPALGPVAASTGKMVGLVSPVEGVDYGWARVMKHEFVHVVNLQQTGFRIPRWYTEGLATAYEGSGVPQSWKAALARRVAADSLFDLENINLGFMRPSSGEDWTLAYYQAQLYVSYMTRTYGPEAPGKLIAAYGKGLDTGAALQSSFGVTRQAFEAGYRRFLAALVRGAAPRGDSLVALARLTNRALAAKDYAEVERLATLGRQRYPWDADWDGGLAVAYRETHRPDSLARVLERRAENDPNDASVRTELARLAADRSDMNAAGRWALEAIQVNVMDPEMHGLLAQSLTRRGRHADAIEEYAAAVQLQPSQMKWRVGEARACVAAGRPARARELLNEVLARDPKHAEARQLLDSIGH